MIQFFLYTIIVCHETFIFKNLYKSRYIHKIHYAEKNIVTPSYINNQKLKRYKIKIKSHLTNASQNFTKQNPISCFLI